MIKYTILTILLLGLFSQTTTAQKNRKSTRCYSDKPFDKQKVFTKMLHTPRFKGGHDSLVNYLMTNIRFQKLVSDLSENERSYADTARVKFIVAKDGSLSDLSVTLTKKKIFEDEITSAIKNSSCNWVAGGTERLLNGWFQFDIYYSIDRRYNEVTTRLKVKEFENATD